MPFTTRQLGLVLAGILLTGSMLVLVPLVTTGLGPLAGYVCVLTIYWVCFCIPVAAFFGRGAIPVTVRLYPTPQWIPVTAFAIPVIVLLAANPAGWMGLEPAVLALAILCALVNGPLEEFAWRRTFRANANGGFSFELLGLGLFTLWHVPLYFSQGITFDYGAVGLVGGAFVMGAFWTRMTCAGDSIGWPIVSHLLVNLVAFPQLFARNFVS